MRIGQFEILALNRLDGTSFRERKINSDMYLQVKDGESYAIVVNVYRNHVSNDFPADDLMFDLFIDGQNVGYRHSAAFSTFDRTAPPQCYMRKIQTALFKGFRHEKNEIRSFIFKVGSIPDLPNIKRKAAPDSPEIKMGTIQLVVRRLSYYKNKPWCNSAIAPETKINEKGTAVASATIAGQRLNDVKVAKAYAFPSPGPPLATLMLTYHNAVVLNNLRTLSQQASLSKQGSLAKLPV